MLLLNAFIKEKNKYRKPTQTDPIVPFNSNHPHACKMFPKKKFNKQNYKHNET